MPPLSPDIASSSGDSPSALNALARWLLRNVQWLKRQLRHRGRSEQEVEDLIGEAIVRVANHCAQHEVHDSAGMLVRTVTRLSINDRRDRARHPYEADSLEALDRVIPFVDRSPSAEDLVETEQNWALIARVLETVDERARESFLLNRVDGMKYREIAQLFGVSVSTVEKDVAWVMSLLIEAANPP
jgi:RNA polymerase sigma-70 factor (ECF subfamily)